MGMTEHDTPQPEEVWTNLSEPEQEACVYFAVSEWSTGMEIEAVRAMGIEDEQLRQLVDKGIVAEKPTWLLFQELADGLESQAKAIRAFSEGDITYRFTENERDILNKYGRYKDIAARKPEEPRYRLTDFTFHDYINSTFGE